jgi:hypothetical protein
MSLTAVGHGGGPSRRGPRRLGITAVEVPDRRGRPPIAVGHSGWNVKVVA